MTECEECHKEIIAFHRLENRKLCLNCFLGIITNKNGFTDKYKDLE